MMQYGSYYIMQHSLDFIDKFLDRITDKTQLQRFLGSLNYISKFVRHCAQDRVLLNKILQKDPIPWTKDLTEAVRRIKEKIMNISPLSTINEEWLETIITNASDIRWGVIFYQHDPNKKEMEYEIFEYASGIQSTTQKKWSSLKNELRVVCLGIAKFEDFVIYKHFIVKTDCEALKFSLHKCDFEYVAIVRWIMTLAQYCSDVEFISGVKHSFADLLSQEFLRRNDVNNLRCNAIGRLEDEIHIECANGSHTLNLQKPLLDYQADWFPMKEIKY